MTSDDLALRFERFQLSLTTKDQCNTTCEYYYRCPLVPRSKETEVFACAARTLDEKSKRRFMNIFVFGEEGVREEIVSNLFFLSEKLDFKDPKEQKDYIQLLLQCYKVLYKGEEKPKSRTEPLTVNVKGIKLPKKPGEAVSVVLEDNSEIQTDPESLFNSPVIDTFVRRRNK